MMKLAGLLILSCALSACAAHQWHRSGVVDPRQFAIDDGYCRATAASSAPTPSVGYINTPSGYAYNGSIYNQYGARAGSYNGYATPMTSPMGSFMNGMANGASMRAVMDARRDRESIRKGCLYSRGWSDQPAPASNYSYGAPQYQTQAAYPQGAQGRALVPGEFIVTNSWVDKGAK